MRNKNKKLTPHKTLKTNIKKINAEWLPTWAPLNKSPESMLQIQTEQRRRRRKKERPKTYLFGYLFV